MKKISRKKIVPAHVEVKRNLRLSEAPWCAKFSFFPSDKLAENTFPSPEKISPLGPSERLGEGLKGKKIHTPVPAMELEKTANSAKMCDMEETFKDAEKWQWMANKEGGQTYGNQMVIAKITPELYEKYIRKLTSGNPTYAAALKKGCVTPDTCVQLTRYGNAGEWKLTKVDDIDKLRPSGEATRWAKLVQDFEHPEAVEWAKKFDCDVYPVRPTHPEMTKAGIGSLSKRVAATLSGKMDATSHPHRSSGQSTSKDGKG